MLVFGNPHYKNREPAVKDFIGDRVAVYVAGLKPGKSSWRFLGSKFVHKDI